MRKLSWLTGALWAAFLVGACGNDGGKGGNVSGRGGMGGGGRGGAQAGRAGSAGKSPTAGGAGTAAGSAGATTGRGTAGHAGSSGGSAGLGGSSTVAGTGSEAGAAQAGEAGEAGAAGGLETGGSAGAAGSLATAGTDSGAGAFGGLAGLGGLGGPGGSGGATPFCTQASDCDAKIGPRGCGAWTCSLAGECEVALRCDDGDGDGFGVGPDCACTGTELDCDDADPAVADSSSASCCNGGRRSCVNGSWGLCSATTGEMCNGVDDDCNGTIDDLPEVSCGLGACRQTVPACSGNQPTACVPLAPTTTVDGCNGVDDDCDGAIDEDCSTCVHVALDGDDAAALASNGATPFRNVQPALDFADAHREIAHRVCVAAGPACGATATYQGPNGDLTMRDGVSLLGNYESTAWTHCSDSTTHLAPQTGRGVVFPANIAIQTALDGFSIERPFADVLVTGVTVDGARGVLLSNLTIVGGQLRQGQYLAQGEGYGVDLRNGAAASVVRSRIEAGYAFPFSAAIHAADSRVLVEDNCASTISASTGRCASTCSASGPQIMGLQGYEGRYAIDLENSPDSRIERNTVCAWAAEDSVDQDAYGSGGILVDGNAKNVVIRANTVDGNVWTSAFRPAAAIFVNECGGASPWIGDNQALSWNVKQSYGEVVRASGDCHPVIEANQQIQNVTAVGLATGRAVVCVAGTVPSRCAIVNNPAIKGLSESNVVTYSAGQESAGTGVYCTGGSCALIRGNAVTGMTTDIHCSSSACQRSGTPLSLQGAGSNRIEGNTWLPGSGPNMGGFTLFRTRPSTLTQGGAVVSNLFSSGMTGWALDFESNFVGGPYPCSASVCGSLTWSGGGTIKNNCIYGSGSTYPAFAETGATSDPLVFQGNNLNAGNGGTIYLDEGTTALTTAAQVNALTDMTVSGNTSSGCSGVPSP